MIEGQIVDRGTGFWQKNVTIYKLHGAHVEVILDEPMEVKFHVPIGGLAKDRLLEVTQTSTFIIKNNSEAKINGAEKDIFETRIVRSGTRIIKRGRTWKWQPGLFRYRSFETAP
jgi:hypothetical protein